MLDRSLSMDKKIGMVEPISLIAGTASEYLLTKFGKSVIERWTRHRAKNFIDSFFLAVAQKKPKEDIHSLLSEILESDVKTEVLFDAYRSVAFSKSRDVGPRAIGLLTAQIISENRPSTGFEDRWVKVFETLSDIELVAVHEFYHDQFQKYRSGTSKDHKVRGKEMEIRWLDETTEFKGKDINRSQLDLNYDLGSWAGPLGNLGMIRTRVTEDVWDYKGDSERHIDEDGTARKTTYWIYLDLPDEEFAELIAGAIPASKPQEQTQPTGEAR